MLLACLIFILCICLGFNVRAAIELSKRSKVQDSTVVPDQSVEDLINADIANMKKVVVHKFSSDRLKEVSSSGKYCTLVDVSHQGMVIYGLKNSGYYAVEAVFKWHEVEREFPGLARRLGAKHPELLTKQTRLISEEEYNYLTQKVNLVKQAELELEEFVKSS